METRNAYLAGLIDGEGCIYARTARRPHHLGANYTVKVYTLYLEISMCSKETIEWVQRNFGGNFREAKPYGTRKTVQYHWRQSNDSAVEILKQAFPYLITKKRQAALAFKLREVMKQTAWQRGSHKWQLRDELIQHIQDLNQRKGPRAVETAHETRETEMIQSDLHSDMQPLPATAAD